MRWWCGYIPNNYIEQLRSAAARARATPCGRPVARVYVLGWVLRVRF